METKLLETKFLPISTKIRMLVLLVALLAILMLILAKALKVQEVEKLYEYTTNLTQ